MYLAIAEIAPKKELFLNNLVEKYMLKLKLLTVLDNQDEIW